jgi:hypothetical protein
MTLFWMLTLILFLSLGAALFGLGLSEFIDWRREKKKVNEI